MTKFNIGDEVRVICKSKATGLSHSYGELYEEAMAMHERGEPLIVERLHRYGKSCHILGLNWFLYTQLELYNTNLITTSSLDYMDSEELSDEDKLIIKEHLENV